jgi:hypothetical protein
LNWDGKKLLWNELFKFADQRLAFMIGIVFMHNSGKRIDFITVDENLQFDQVTCTIF